MPNDSVTSKPTRNFPIPPSSLPARYFAPPTSLVRQSSRCAPAPPILCKILCSSGRPILTGPKEITSKDGCPLLDGISAIPRATYFANGTSSTRENVLPTTPLVVREFSIIPATVKLVDDMIPKNISNLSHQTSPVSSNSSPTTSYESFPSRRVCSEEIIEEEGWYDGFHEDLEDLEEEEEGFVYIDRSDVPLYVGDEAITGVVQLESYQEIMLFPDLALLPS